MKTQQELFRFVAGRNIHTCNAFELEHFDVERMRSGDGDMATGDVLFVHDGTAVSGTLPEVYERDGDTLRLVEWWK